jgi:tRNA1(Val) A37 N6-methylase TrmN6
MKIMPRPIASWRLWSRSSRLSADLTTDAFLSGRVQLSQPARGYRAGLDAVMLAAAVTAPARARVLEFGCGAGAALLCLAARRADVTLIGVDRQPDMVALAHANAAANHMADRVAVMEGDIARLGEIGVFDAVMMNPPFFDPEAGLASPDPQKRASAHWGEPLELWIKAAANRLTGGAMLTIVHQTTALPELLAALDGRLGGVEVAPLWPRVGQPAKRILVRARKGSRAAMTLHPGLVLHDANGFTPAARAILADGAPFDW